MLLKMKVIGPLEKSDSLTVAYNVSADYVKDLSVPHFLCDALEYHLL